MRAALVVLAALMAGCSDRAAPAVPAAGESATGDGGSGTLPSAGTESSAGASGQTTSSSGGSSGSSSGGSGSGDAGLGGGGSAGSSGAAGSGGSGGEGPLTVWPDMSNTGVPPDVALTPAESLEVTTTGQIVEGLDVQGSIIVRADDVVIRNCRITNKSTAIRFEEGSNLRVEHVTFVGHEAKTLDGAIQAWGDLVVRRIQVSGFGEGIDVYGAGGLIEDSYFHDMQNADGKLMDGIEAWEAKGLTIRHNVIEMPDGNSVIKLPLDVPVPGGDDVLIENNLLAGGGYTVYGGYDPPNENPSYTNVRFVGNRFSTKYGPKCGYYGPGAFIESALSHDNVWHESGDPLEL